jgi:hypothetical protein
MNPGLSGGLAAAGVVLFLAILRSISNRPAKRDATTGDLVLQSSSVLVWTMGIIAVVAPVGLAILSAIFPFKNEREVFIPIVMGGFFLLVGGLTCFWAIRRRTRINERGMTSEYMLAKPQFLSWNEVASVSFANGQEFWVRGANGNKALVHVMLFTGVKDAAPFVVAHLPERVRAECHKTIDRFIRATGAQV